MTATLHKLTAGDGYVYLVRQVAAADATERGRPSLADYYSAKGESPGKWIGSGLSALTVLQHEPVRLASPDAPWRVDAGSEVTEDQMRALFGEGLHPNAVAITEHFAKAGLSGPAAIRQSRLGAPFAINPAATAFQRALAVAYRDHNRAAGRHWAAAIDDAQRATIRTAVARAQFAEQFGRPPADERELSGFIARGSRAATTAVAGYDVTFSPVKSVAALWAVAPRQIAAEIEQAHDAAVAAAFDFLQANAAYTRTGAQGIAQLDTTGLIAAAFTHRDSRAGDPDLHTHVAISNKVAVLDADGLQRWYALDGQPLHRVMVAASELYNTALEAQLDRRLGVAFAETEPARPGKRPIREIVGVDQALMTRWSSRRVAIEARTAELAKAFQADHGREPTSRELIALAQQATLETREAKHEPRSLAEQRAVWRTQALEVLGSQQKLAAMLAGVLAPAVDRSVAEVTEEWVQGQAAAVIATIAQSRATWQHHHVLAEAQRRARYSGHAAHPGLAQRITAAALAEGVSVPIARTADDDLGEPAALRRADGTSIYRRAGVALYTSAQVLAAERRVVAAAARRDGRATHTQDVRAALDDAAAHGRTLNPGQQALVLEMATSGARVQLALAPAGSGKTTAMAALSHAWRHSGGNVIGLAPTASAAITLGGDLGTATDTVDKYIQLIDNTAGSVVPDWFSRVGPGTLIIIDEAGLAGTVALDAVISNALARGASVRLVGDDAQLASVAAGGVLRDVAETSQTLTLTQLVRFTTADQGFASLALREGNPAGIAYFIDHQRVHVGVELHAAQMAFQAWWDDTRAGKDSLLLAPDNTTVDQLNAWARQARLAAAAEAAEDFAVGTEIVLADGLAASIGDRIRTRKNSRSLKLSATDFVRNGYTYTITGIDGDGSLRARHDGTGRAVHLPAGYVAESVTLGYARTIASAQGLTAGHSSHTVIAESMTRQDLYVATSRAKAENHLYTSTAEGDPHRVLAPKATHPDTAVDILAKITARDGRQVSATTAERAAADPLARMAAAAAMYHHAVTSLAEAHLPAGELAALAAAADGLHPDLTSSPTWPVLRAHLAMLAADGIDATAALAAAVDDPDSLTSATDPAAVIIARLDPAARRRSTGPLPWLPAIPAALADPDTPVGRYLADRAKLVTTLTAGITDQAHAWTAKTAPDWAKGLIAADARKLAARIAVYRAAHGVDPADQRILGPAIAADTPASRAVAAALRRALERTIATARPALASWAATLDALDPRIRTDSYWLTLADSLAALAAVRPDLHTHLTAALAERPLPDEAPAAALWWRLTGRLGLIAAASDPHHQPTYPWLADLQALVGTATTELITADADFNSLAAHLDAVGDRWEPAELLAVAVERIRDAADLATINPRHYGRLIAATVAEIAAHQPTDPAPLPEQPPLTREEEEQLAHLDDIDPAEVGDTTAAAVELPDEALPPDPHHDLDLDAAYPLAPESPASGEPAAWPGPDSGAEDLGPLDFTDLATTRPAAPPTITAALTDLTAARTAYAAALAAHTELAAAIDAGRGPAQLAAADALATARAEAAATATARQLLAELLAAWSDAEDDHTATQTLIDATQDRLAAARTADTPDPDLIASLKADLAVLALQLPAQTPAEQYWPRINAARQALAGKPTPDSIDAQAAAARHSDLQALADAARHTHTCRRELDRAEHLTAIAYRHAHPDTLDQLLANTTAISQELAVLAAAGTTHTHNPLTITAAGDDPAGQALATIAAQPYTLTLATIPATAATELPTALNTLATTATAAGRTVYQPTDPAEHLRTWQPTPGDIVVITDPTTSSPETLHALTETAAQASARIIVISTTTPDRQPTPTDRLLNLLHTDLPWQHTHPNLPGSPRPIAGPAAADLQPALTQTSQLPDHHLQPHHRQALTQRAELRAKHRQLHQLHDLGRRISRHAPTPSLDTGLEL